MIRDESVPAMSRDELGVWSEGAMNIADAAAFCGVSERTIYNQIYSGEIARSKVRARTVVPRKQLRMLLERGAGR